MEDKDINAIKEFLPRLVNQLTEAKAMLKKNQNQIDAILDADKSYRDTADVIRQMKLKKNGREFELISTETNKYLLDRKEEYKDKVQDLRIALSDYLATYAQQAGTNQVELANGEVISFVAKFSIKPKQMRLFY